MRRNPAFDPATVRDARYAAGLTVPDLAGRVGVSVGTVKAWEAGRRTPRAATLQRLAGTLGLAVDDLIDPGVRLRDLADLRSTAGLDVANAAAALGLSTSMLRRVEAGELLPPDPVAMCQLYRFTQARFAEAARMTHPRS